MFLQEEREGSYLKKETCNVRVRVKVRLINKKQRRKRGAQKEK